MSYPRFQLARAFKVVRLTTGDFTTTGQTAWGDVNTALDITLAAQVGDVIEYGIMTEATNGSAAMRMDVATIVSAAVVNYFGGDGTAPAGTGAAGWYVNGVRGVSGSVWRTLVAGDISSGYVTLRLRYHNDGAGGTNNFTANAGRGFYATAKNLGPQDPN
jgi:hypothetical protein